MRGVRAARAERAINYRTEDFVEVVKQLTGGKGVDVILDMVGGEYVPREIKCLATDGRLSIIAFPAGPRPRWTWVTFLSPAHPHRLDAAAAQHRVQGTDRRRATREGLAAARSGPLKPVIYRRFRWTVRAAAHAGWNRACTSGRYCSTSPRQAPGGQCDRSGCDDCARHNVSRTDPERFYAGHPERRRRAAQQAQPVGFLREAPRKLDVLVDFRLVRILATEVHKRVLEAESS